VKRLLIKKRTFSDGVPITLIATPLGGLMSDAGGFLDGNFDHVGGDHGVFLVSANARGVSYM
jgi:hypothetical protein